MCRQTREGKKNFCITLLRPSLQIAAHDNSGLSGLWIHLQCILRGGNFSWRAIDTQLKCCPDGEGPAWWNRWMVVFLATHNYYSPHLTPRNALSSEHSQQSTVWPSESLPFWESWTVAWIRYSKRKTNVETPAFHDRESGMRLWWWSSKTQIGTAAVHGDEKWSEWEEQPHRLILLQAQCRYIFKHETVISRSGSGESFTNNGDRQRGIGDRSSTPKLEPPLFVRPLLGQGFYIQKANI